MPIHGSTIKTDLKPIAEAYNIVLSGNRNSLRLPQIQYIVTCFEGASNDLPVIIEGPTGLGKTKALLTVAIAYLNTTPGARVLYTTRTIPQLQNIDSDLEELAERLRPISNQSETFFGVYIGIGSIRRLFCQRFLKGITMDPNELRSHRLLMNDPDKPEPCPDCEIRHLRSKRISDADIPKFHKFGLEEIAQMVKDNKCPVPYMRDQCKKSKIVLSTYPYLFNDYWKTTILGGLSLRKQCLPIIDEAHNILDTITETPSLTIALTPYLEPGQGLDLSGNTYFLSSLVDDLKYGYKKAITGHLSKLYSDTVDSERTSQKELIKQISEYHKKHKQLCELSVSTSEMIKALSSKVEQIKSGINPEFEKGFPYNKDVRKSLEHFKKAKVLASERDSMIAKLQEAKSEHQVLCRQNMGLRAQRDALQQKGKEYSSKVRDTWINIQKQMYFDAKQGCFRKAQEVHESMMKYNVDIECLNKIITESQKSISGTNNDQRQSYLAGESIIDEIFSRLKDELAKNSNQIRELRSIIANFQQQINEYEVRLSSIGNAWNILLRKLQDNEDIDQIFTEFYDALKIPYENRNNNLSDILSNSFSLYAYLSKFRCILLDLLSPLSAGPVGEAELGIIVRQLNDRLQREAGKDIAQFLERCEESVIEFESSMLGTDEAWSGIAVYGLRQMYRMLLQICEGPYGFAATIDQSGKAPRISFHSLDPAARFRETYHDLKSPILTSATLSPVADVANILGLNHGIKAKITPVFPIENYLSFAYLGCNSSPKTKGELSIFNSFEKNILREQIGSILSATKCHTGLFCASHKVLNATIEVISRDYVSAHGMKLLIARSDGMKVDDDYGLLRKKVSRDVLLGMGEFDARLKLFMELSGKVPILLAGVTGGGLSEGVDFEGKAMELAIIIGIPYQDEGERAWLNNRRTSFFKMRTGDAETGKDLAYRQTAIRKVAQTAGRVHRSMQDKGVIIFFDERLLGLKNCDTSGPSRYEILNAINTRRHWDIVQSRIFESLYIVIPPDFATDDASDLSRYMERVFKSNTSIGNRIPEIIESDKMIMMLKRFYQ
jgi:Rad3-related DNA helicase